MKKIGEVAALFGTTPRTLLYYEEQGILTPDKTGKGTRVYASGDIRRFAVAFELAGLGIPIRRIREIVEASERATSKEEAARAQSSLLTDLGADLRDQIGRLERAVADIEAGRSLIDGTFEAHPAEASAGRASAKEGITPLPAICALLADFGDLETRRLTGDAEGKRPKKPRYVAASGR
ncbi:MerR family transcriptional regulator [Fulvimarina endophytica]|uniref:MerR family transcriptional regulator n=1 Tax=Fulvimarina endophytica TaxID=2293836 RepID=UPI0013143BFC|nr:MerR family transcriptional regulator [Fulvimarina endophytica]